MKLKDLISKCVTGDLFMFELMDKDGYVTTWYLFNDLFRLDAKVYDPIAESEVILISSTRSGIYVRVRDPEVWRYGDEALDFTCPY